MAKIVGDKIVKPAPMPPGGASYDELRRAAMEQSPVSTIDPKKYAKGR